MEEIKSKETWNKKRIFAALFLIILLAIGGYVFRNRIFNMKLSFQDPKSVKGVTTKEENKAQTPTEARIDIQKAVKEKLEELKKNALNIDVAEIASSSPQIQKLIKDLSSIRDYPANQAKEICEKVCSGL